MAKKPIKKIPLFLQVRPEFSKKLRVMAAQEGQKLAAMLELVIEDSWEKRAPSYR